MFDLTDYKAEELLYGQVRAGWRDGKVYRAALHNGQSKKDGKEYQYLKVDFEVDGVLVPAFFFYRKGQEKPDQMLGKLLSVAGMVGQSFLNNQAAFFQTLIGTELRVKVAHKFPKTNHGQRVRRDRVVDCAPMRGDEEPDIPF